MSENANRGTQFAGFAVLLIQEIDEVFGAVTKWSVEHDIDDEAKIGQELKTRWLTIVSRRAYDFACHVVGETIGGHPDVSHVPDMTTWPEETGK